MAITVLILVPALVRRIHVAGSLGSRPARLWVGASLVAGAWSLLLLLQGETSFYTYRELLKAQADQLVHSASILVAAAALLAGGVLGWRRIRRRHAVDPGGWIRWEVGTVSVMVLAYLGAALLGAPPEQRIAFVVAGLALSAAGGLAWVILPRVAGAIRRVRPAGWTSALPPAGMAALMVWTCGLFTRLYARTEQTADRGPHRPAYACTSAVLWDELQESAVEYSAVDGVEEEQAALQDFLSLVGGRECPALILPRGGSGLGRMSGSNRVLEGPDDSLWRSFELLDAPQAVW
jgi:hypothetical protein